MLPGEDDGCTKLGEGSDEAEEESGGDAVARQWEGDVPCGAEL